MPDRRGCQADRYRAGRKAHPQPQSRRGARPTAQSGFQGARSGGLRPGYRLSAAAAVTLVAAICRCEDRAERPHRSEEHTSELQSLMRISYAAFILKKKKDKHTQTT